VVKVAMVSPWAVRCGIYTYTRDLSKALADLGCEVYVVRLHRFSRKDERYFEHLARRIPDVDLVHVQDEYGLFQGHDAYFLKHLVASGRPGRPGRPVVVTMHAVGNWGIDKAITDLPVTVIVHNRFCASKFPGDSVIIPHGLTPRQPAPRDEARRKMDIPQKARMVGYCGFLAPNKGLETLIDAVSSLDKVGLLVGGGWHVEGPSGQSYIEGLKAQAAERLKNRCRFLGFVPEEDLPALYGAVDLVVYPSRYATESGALLMALGFGKAVVASDLPAFREKEERGVLLTFSDTDDLAQKIRFLLDEESSRRSLEEGARRYAEENSWQRIAQRHLELYRDLVDLA